MNKNGWAENDGPSVHTPNRATYICETSSRELVIGDPCSSSTLFIINFYRNIGIKRAADDQRKTKRGVVSSPTSSRSQYYHSTRRCHSRIYAPETPTRCEFIEMNRRNNNEIPNVRHEIGRRASKRHNREKITIKFISNENELGQWIH